MIERLTMVVLAAKWLRLERCASAIIDQTPSQGIALKGGYGEDGDSPTWRFFWVCRIVAESAAFGETQRWSFSSTT